MIRVLLLLLALQQTVLPQPANERLQARRLLNRGQAELKRGDAAAAWNTLHESWMLIITNRFDGMLMRSWNLLTASAQALHEPRRMRRLLNQTLRQSESPQIRKNAPWILLGLGLGTRARNFKLELWEAALKAAAHVSDERARQWILFRWGHHCFLRGEFACASLRLQEAVQVANALGDNVMAGNSYSRLARVYLQHDQFSKALEYCTKAREMLRNGGQAFDRATVELDFGRVYLAFGKRKEALAQFETAQAIGETAPRSKDLNGLWGVLATAYAAVGDYGRATALLERALANTDLDNVAGHQALLARAYLELGRFDDAIRTATAAVDISFKRRNRLFYLEAHRARAFAYEAKGDHEAAIADVRKALASIDALAAKAVPTDFMKRGYFEHQTRLVQLGVKLLFDAGRHKEALEIAEFGRSRAFLNLLASRGSEVGDVEDFEAPSEEEGPTLASDQSLAALTAGRMTERLAKLQSTMLSYYVTPDATYLWLLSPSGALHGVRRQIKETSLRAMIEQLRLRKSRVDADTLRGLHRMLIEPLVAAARLKAGTRLLVVPHGPMFDLPFAALLDSQGRYLLESYPLHYTYSVGLFDHLESLPAAPPQASYLLVAATSKVAGLPGKALPALPGAKLEVERIAKAVAPAPVVTLAGAPATADQVRHDLPGRSVLHFASHAVVDKARPFDSYLALSGGSRLTASDIYDLRVNAELVVLSACRSASGAISADGVLGLTRALFYAGARRVVASIWDVGDEPASRLIADFHREYRRSGDKAVALRTAQLRLLAALRAGEVTVSTGAGDIHLPEHPMLWAGFLLQGAP